MDVLWIDCGLIMDWLYVMIDYGFIRGFRYV